jgi:hypothetical protein
MISHLLIMKHTSWHTIDLGCYVLTRRSVDIWPLRGRDGRMITIDMRPVIQQVQQPSYRRSITAKLVSIALTTVGLRAGLSTVCEESRLQNGTRSAVSRKNVIVSSMAQGTLLPLLQGAPWQEEFWRKRSGISGPADSDETMC